MSKEWNLSCTCSHRDNPCPYCKDEATRALLEAAKARQTPKPDDVCQAKNCGATRADHHYKHAFKAQTKNPDDKCDTCGNPRVPHNYRHIFKEPMSSMDQLDAIWSGEGQVVDPPKPAITGYHSRPISKGVYGESSKIQEELEELFDAEDQGMKIMGLIEVTDIVGAVEGYLTKHYPGTSFEDVLLMARATSRAFKSGERK